MHRFVALLFLLFPSLAFANNKLSIVDHKMLTDFVPETVHVLVETSKGSLKQLPASAVSVSNNKSQDSNYQFRVGAVISYEETLAEDLKVVFVLRAEEAFATSPVISFSKEDLEQNKTLMADIVGETDNMSSELREINSESEELRFRLNSMRNMAADLAGIDELIDIREQIRRLEDTGHNSAQERDRLQALYARAKELEDSEAYYAMLQNLSKVLVRTAASTATADKIANRKREAAQESYQQKIDLVNQMAVYDSDELARQLLELRTTRRSLERQLGAGSISVDEF